MTTIVVLFNLKEGVNRDEYEQWARTVDIPNVRRLNGCSGFEVLRSQGLLGGSPDAPMPMSNSLKLIIWMTLWQPLAHLLRKTLRRSLESLPMARRSW